MNVKPVCSFLCRCSLQERTSRCIHVCMYVCRHTPRAQTLQLPVLLLYLHMYECINLCISLHMYLPMYAHRPPICLYELMYAYLCTSLHMYVFMHSYLHTHRPLSYLSFSSIYICMNVFTYAFLFTCIYLCIPISTHTDLAAACPSPLCTYV